MDLVNEMSRMRPKTIAELLPELNGLPKHTLQILSSTTKSRPQPQIPRTTEKTFKTMNLAELMATIPGLKNNNKKTPQKMSTAKKKKWNSSVKLENKKINHTATSEAKQSRARKMLTFQTKPEMLRCNPNTDTQKIALKTPVYNSKGLAIHNKRHLQDTPLSCASSGDESFLRNEKQICGTSLNPKTAEPIALTPFRKYRNIKNCLDDSGSSNIDDSGDACNDTVKSFDNIPIATQEDSCIGSLCDLVCKTNINQTSDTNDKAEQARANVKLLENAMDTIETFRSSHKTFIENCDPSNASIQTINASENIFIVNNIINELLQVKRFYINYLEQLDTKKQSTLENSTNNIENVPPLTNQREIAYSPKSSRSKTYKIPKKNSPFQKQIFKKSLLCKSPKFDAKACIMYMDMKKRMDFLQTPTSKRLYRKLEDTPTVTSRNLQVQLSKLYDES